MINLYLHLFSFVLKRPKEVINIEIKPFGNVKYAFCINDCSTYICVAVEKFVYPSKFLFV